MIQNGLGVGRKHIHSIASKSSSAAIAPTPFVCASCRARGFASRRGGRLAGNEPLKESLRRLEKHVQVLESSFKDLQKRRAAELVWTPNFKIIMIKCKKSSKQSLTKYPIQESPAQDASEALQDEAYKALMSDAPQVNLLQPPPLKGLKSLPAPVLERIGVNNTAIVALGVPEWSHMLVTLDNKGGFRDMTTKQVNQTIAFLPPEIVTINTDLLMKMIKDAQIKTQNLTFDFLMRANAEMGNTKKVRELFVLLKECSKFSMLCIVSDF